jgi:4-hydroxy-tetrahydrodipicolinate synthase
MCTPTKYSKFKETSMTNPLCGVYAAAVTPLKEDFSPDLSAIFPLLNFLAQRGCHGALLLGTTGEGPSFSARERLEILRAALEIRQTHPHFRLLAGVGTPSLSETADLTRAAFEMGYDAALSLPPYYFRKAGEEGLFQWFAELIRRAVPADGVLLGYHIPAVAGIGFSLNLLARLRDAFPAQFAGIKDSSHDADFAEALGARFGNEMLVFNGTDSYLQRALNAHAAGCITAPANLISPELRAVWDAFQSGTDPSAAQTQVTHKRHLLEAYTPFPSILKVLLAGLHQFPLWRVRPPLEDTPHEQFVRAMQEWQA